jgi:signal recognition particle subunit SRP72
LLQAVLDAKANRLEDGLQTLSQFASSASAEAALTVGLASLQLLLEKKDVERAVTLLEQLLQKNFRLGLLGALVSLHTGRGQRDKAIGFVNQALDKINREKSKSPDAEIKLLKQAAAFHFKGGDAQKAANCLEQLVKLESSTGETNTGNLARLVLLYSQFDPALAQKTSQQLPPLTLDSGPGAVDVDALEAATWALGLKHARKGPATGGISSPGSGPGSKKTTDKDAVQKKKKKRKIRLPKHYDPNTPPDPERWLPRRERSTYRPKKRDRRHRDARADVGKGTQGTSAAALEAENKL